MIKYKDLKIEDLVSWIKSNAQIRNKSAILIEVDNTIASIVNVLLAKKTGLPVHVVIDFNYYKNNFEHLKEICSLLKIDHSIISDDEDIEYWQPYDFSNDKRIIYTSNPLLKTDLEKTAKIAYIAETTNSIVPSNITRDDYLFVRNYPKINPWDIMPFANLSMATVNSIFENLINKSYIIERFIENAPKPNLDIEWLYSANERSKSFPGDAHSEGMGPSIIKSECDPTKHKNWYTYTTSQKALIAKVHQVEKLTRYKVNENIPKFSLEMEDD